MRLALTKRRWLVVLLGPALALAVPPYMKWREASNRGGQKPAEPFRIAGNLGEIERKLLYRQKHRIRAGGDRQPRAPFAADAVAPWPAQGQGRA